MKILFEFFIALIFSGTLVLAGGVPRVEMFSPQGTVKDVRQVKARFSEPMVPFGDPRLDDPFLITCPEKGKGRWVDGKTWTYDFEKDLPAGMICEFQLKAGVKTLAHEPITNQKLFSFNTGGPAVRSSRPAEGDIRIDENQIFIFSLDAEADEASVYQQVYFSVEGLPERVGLRVIKGEEKEKLLQALKYKKDKSPHIVFQAKQTFPPGSEVKIIWGHGVKSLSGIPTPQDQVLVFKIRQPFFAKFRGKKEKPDAGCIPLMPMKLVFSAPVPWEKAKQCVLKSRQGKHWKPKAEGGGDPRLVERILFEGPFPEKSSFTLTIPKNLKDDAGRPLDNQAKFPLTIKTDRYPSLAKFASRFGILELQEGGLLPLTIRNLEAELKTWMHGPDGREKDGEEKTSGSMKKETDGVTLNIKGKIHQLGIDQEEKVIEWLTVLRSAKRERSILRGKEKIEKISIPKKGTPKEFEVIGVPLPKPGFYVVELESAILGSRLLAKPAPMFVPAGALVTNLAAHFKRGRASSLVWVTTLDKGEPVKEAMVTLRDCTGKKRWEGKTDGAGIAKITTELPSERNLPRCPDRQEIEEFSPPLAGIRGGLFVFAKTSKDFTFTHSTWDQGIEPWRFNVPGGAFSDQDDLLTHTVFDRTLFRAGDEVHMKHFLRMRSMTGLSIPSKTGDLNEVLIEHAQSSQHYFFPLKWRADGIAETLFKIPENAKLGTYRVYLTTKSGNPKSGADKKLTSGSFRVEAFRVPLMKAIIQGPRDPVIKAKEVEADLSISYLSGGGASGLPVKLRTEILPKFLSFPDYEEWVFSNGRVKPGIVRSEEYSEDYDEQEEGLREPDHTEKKGKLQTLELILDKQGGARAKLSGLPEIDAPKDILAELEFRDPNGEIQTQASRIPIYPAKWLVGIDSGSEDAPQGSIKIRVAVLDLKGKPVPQAEVKMHLLERKTYSHRRRLFGGFYAFENITEVKALGLFSQGKTDQNGVWSGVIKSPVTGRLVLQAEVLDPQNNPAAANKEIWVYGPEDQWFEGRNDDRIDLIPEKKRLESGETARFQVKMPFRQATALITVEREGIMDAYVKKLERNRPVVEIPIKENYVPNVFVSALVVRGRVPKTRPTAFFDPGKPSYKLGLTELQVGWKPHELNVEVLPDKKIYSVRETVTARIKVKTASGKVLPKGSEAALAVVDEGLLELKPNESWKLLEAMMRRKGCEVETSTAQMMVVGKRHFGRKALPHGGGGGRQLTRELFDTLIYWKGAVALDEKGEAIIKFPLNDSLTSFRIVAVVHGGQGFFGTGGTTVRTTQDLMILSGIPPLIREGDRYTAGFTIRNASQKEMKIEARLNVKGLKERKELAPKREIIKAGEAREMGWEILVPLGLEKLDFEAAVKEIEGEAHDRLTVSQKVVPAVPVRTFQATLVQVKDPLSIDVERPEEAAPGRGGIDLQMRPKLSGGLSGLSEYMKRYPYSCLEQKISKAVVLSDSNKEIWPSLMAELPSYLDGEGLSKFFPAMRQGSDVLTAYLLAVSKEAGLAVPGPLKDTLIKGLKGFIEGKVVRPSTLPTADLAIRKMAAIEALSRYGEAGKGLLSTITIEPNLWPTSTLLDWINILSRVKDIPDHSKKMKEAEQILRSRLNLQGTTMGLSTEKTDNLWWILATPDTNAVKTLLTTLQMEGWKDDHPRMVRGLLGRMKKGHWDTTTANAWGLLAMKKFGTLYESAPVTGLTVATLHNKTEAVDWAKMPIGRKIHFPWVEKKEKLRIAHKGYGAPWATVQSLAALSLKQPFSSGYSIKKIIIPIEQKSKNLWTRGDLVRVRLELEAQADMTWVVVSDPIPAGSMILGSGLGRDSGKATQDELERGWAWETFRERSLEALRVYYEYVPKGKWTVEYTLRLNNDGLFHLPETRVEALYSPEMFGELPNKAFSVRPSAFGDE